MHAKLQQRAAEGKPVRVGLIGAGKFGSMYLAQVPRTPACTWPPSPDLSPANARANLAASAGNRNAHEPPASTKP